MHYYKFNIGDYRRDTGHLSLVEHGIYRVLLDTYILDEKPLCADKAKLMRSHCVRTADEEKALENVLADFFVLTNEGYLHKRCEREIEEFHGKAEKAKQSALVRWANNANALKNDANAMRTGCEDDANHKPLTINHKPLTILKDLSPQAEPTQKSKRGTRLSEDWKPTLEFWDEAKLINPNILDARLTQIAAEFRDYWISKSGASATKTDWLATWRNWIRKERPAQGAAPQNQFLSAREKTAQRNAEIFDINRARDF